MRDEQTPQDVCGEATDRSSSDDIELYNILKNLRTNQRLWKTKEPVQVIRFLSFLVSVACVPSVFKSELSSAEDGACTLKSMVFFVHRRKMSAHALLKMTRDLFRAMSLALRQKCPRNVVEMKEAMAAFF